MILFPFNYPTLALLVVLLSSLVLPPHLSPRNLRLFHFNPYPRYDLPLIILREHDREVEVVRDKRVGLQVTLTFLAQATEPRHTNNLKLVPVR